MSLVLTLLFSVLLDQQQQTVGNRYFHKDGGPGVFMRPAWLSNPAYSTQTVDGTSSFKLTFSETPNLVGYKIMIQAFFPGTEGVTGMFADRSVVAVLSGFSFLSEPNLIEGQAGIVERPQFPKVGEASFSLVGNDLIVTYAATLVNNKVPNYVRAICLPTNFDITQLRGSSINSIYPVQLYSTDQATRRPMEPTIPEEYTPPFDPPPEGGATKLIGKLDRHVPTENFSLTSPLAYPHIEGESHNQQAQPIPGQTPKESRPRGTVPEETHGPDWGTGTGMGTEVWPVPSPPPSGWMAVDLNGVGGNNDYILPGHDPIPYTDSMLGYVIIDGKG